MATRKTIKSMTLNSQQLSPAGDASVPTANNSWEAMDNLDDTVDYKYNPAKEDTTLSIALDDEARKIITDLAKITGWVSTISFRDGTAIQISSCALTSIPALDGDGAVELSVHGIVRWL